MYTENYFKISHLESSWVHILKFLLRFKIDKVYNL